MTERLKKTVSAGEAVCNTGHATTLRKKKKRSKWETAVEIAIVSLFSGSLILRAIVLVIAYCLFFMSFILILLTDPLVYHKNDRRKLADWESGKYLETESEELGERASYIIPSFSDCSGYSSASFYWNGNEYGFQWTDYCMYSACLDLTFEEGTYAAAKEQALSSHHFLEAPVGERTSENGTFYDMPVAQTTIGGYDVRIVDENRHEWGVNEDEYLTRFPSSFGFLAFQDKKMAIRYCYVYNSFAHSWDETDKFIKYIKLNFPVDWK